MHRRYRSCRWDQDPRVVVRQLVVDRHVPSCEEGYKLSAQQSRSAGVRPVVGRAESP